MLYTWLISTYLKGRIYFSQSYLLLLVTTKHIVKKQNLLLPISHNVCSSLLSTYLKANFTLIDNTKVLLKITKHIHKGENLSWIILKFYLIMKYILKYLRARSINQSHLMFLHIFTRYFLKSRPYFSQI